MLQREPTGISVLGTFICFKKAIFSMSFVTEQLSSGKWDTQSVGGVPRKGDVPKKGGVPMQVDIQKVGVPKEKWNYRG